jgi:hypothetical protein
MQSHSERNGCFSYKAANFNFWGLNLKRSKKIIQKFLLIAVSSFLLFQPTLNDPCVIAEIAIFYPTPAYEVAHWEALFPQARQNNYQGLLNISLPIYFFITDPFNQVSHQLSSPFIPHQQSINLRC